MVTQYSYENIIALNKYNRFILPIYIVDIIDEYTKLVSSPSYIKSPHFVLKRSIILDNTRNNFQHIKDTIKKILNKITEKNYDKLSIELLSNLKNLIQETKNIDDNNNIIEKTVEMIFNNFFTNSVNIDLNIKIVNILIYEFNYFQDYLDNFIDNCKNLQNEIEICKSISFEEIDRINKKNNIVKNKIAFLCKLENIKKIEKKDINKLIINYQNLFNNLLNQDYSKMECDEIAELILTFLNQKESLDINDSLESIIIKNINSIIETNVIHKKNLSVKIILKHKNILRKLKL